MSSNNTEKTKGFFGKFNSWFSRRRENYLNSADRFARRKWRALALIALFAVGLYLSMRQLPTAFLPQEDDGYFMIAVELPDAASLERTEVVLEEIREIVKKSPAVESIASLAGFNMLSS